MGGMKTELQTDTKRFITAAGIQPKRRHASHRTWVERACRFNENVPTQRCTQLSPAAARTLINCVVCFSIKAKNGAYEYSRVGSKSN